jgi:hypothetical protein
LHALVTTLVAGFMSPADKVRLNAIVDAAILVFGVQSVSNTTTTRYIPFGFLDSTAPTSRVSFRIPSNGILRKLRVRHNSPGFSPNVVIYTVHVNGVATALSATLPANGADASDLVDNINVSAGDLIDLVMTKPVNLGGSSNLNVTVSLEVAYT